MSKELVKRILSSIILIPIALFFVIMGSFLFIFFISVCFCIIFYEWHMMSRKKNYNIYGFIFLTFSFVSIYQLQFNSDIEPFWLLFIIIVCVSTDVGGYIFGKIFKGPKLTKFSPKKTYAGMIGGYLLSLIFISIINTLLVNQELPISWLVFALLISTVSQIGDIIVSYFKRLAKIKDTGKIIPGHGGLLDRVDGMIFAFPFSYIFILNSFLV
tara:strand:+ start:239 stop:877 length:639 start_codon:yes stop_codon:yes gene_type:complete